MESGVKSTRQRFRSGVKKANLMIVIFIAASIMQRVHYMIKFVLLARPPAFWVIVLNGGRHDINI